MNSKVYVTGYGTVTPLGVDTNTSLDSILHSKSAAKKINDFSEYGIKTSFFGPSDISEADFHLTAKELRRTDRFIHLAHKATLEAFRSAGLNDLESYKNHAGVIYGTSMGGIATLEKNQKLIFTNQNNKVSPFMITGSLANMAAAYLSQRFKVFGPINTLKNACATGLMSIGEGYRLIKHNYCDIVIVGASESSISPTTIAGFEAMNALTKESTHLAQCSRPWDQKRSGFLLSEGAGTIILESEKSLNGRKGTPLCEVLAYANFSDAFHVAKSDEFGIGIQKSMLSCIDEAKIDLKDIQAIFGHATSTPIGDQAELRAYNQIFSSGHQPLLTCLKGHLGHTLAASGAIESALAIEAIRRGFITETLNFEKNEEDFKILPLKQKKPINNNNFYFLKNSLGFGGINASVLFRTI